LSSPNLVDSGPLIYMPDETLFIRSFDAKAVVCWTDFEYVLTLILENRILKVYSTHLQEVS